MSSLALATSAASAPIRPERRLSSAAVLPFPRTATAAKRPSLTWVLDSATGALRQSWSSLDQRSV